MYFYFLVNQLKPPNCHAGNITVDNILLLHPQKTKTRAND